MLQALSIILTNRPGTVGRTLTVKDADSISARISVTSGMDDQASVGVYISDDNKKRSLDDYKNEASFDGSKATAKQEFSKAEGNYIGLNLNRESNPVPTKWDVSWGSYSEITGDESEVHGYKSLTSVERTGTGVFSSGTSSQDINYAKGNSIEVGTQALDNVGGNSANVVTTV